MTDVLDVQITMEREHVVGFRLSVDVTVVLHLYKGHSGHHEFSMLSSRCIMVMIRR